MASTLRTQTYKEIEMEVGRAQGLSNNASLQATPPFRLKSSYGRHRGVSGMSSFNTENELTSLAFMVTYGYSGFT